VQAEARPLDPTVPECRSGNGYHLPRRDRIGEVGRDVHGVGARVVALLYQSLGASGILAPRLIGVMR